jgi:hypothetical protein
VYLLGRFQFQGFMSVGFALSGLDKIRGSLVAVYDYVYVHVHIHIHIHVHVDVELVHARCILCSFYSSFMRDGLLDAERLS